MKFIGFFNRGTIFIYVWYAYMFYLVYLFRGYERDILYLVMFIQLMNGVAIKSLLENDLEVIDGKVVDNIGLLN